ncbi:MAG: amidohydrolase family protein [Dehalococcoidia bacterium]|nr:amidohydrolase family protein [Dehalococcoidia bacterium]
MPKKSLVIDAQNHFVPREAAATANKTEGVDFAGRARKPNAAYVRAFDIEATLRHMEDCGIDMALIALATWITPGMEVCRAINDAYAKVGAAHPGKFLLMAHVPYHEGPGAIKELHRCINDLGMRGVTVLTSVKDITLDEEAMFPFYEEVCRLDVPIVVHPSVKEPIWGGVKYDMSSSVSREYDIAKCVVEVSQGVLPRYPDLKFVFPHYGGGIPALKGRIMSWYSLAPTDLPEENRGLPRTIKEVEDFQLMPKFNKYFDKIYFDMAGFGGWMTIARAALEAIKHERLCFGTDYPFEMRRVNDLKTYIENIRALDIPGEEIEAILGGNLQRLFKI